MYQPKSKLAESRFQSVNIPIERVEERNYQFSSLGGDLREDLIKGGVLYPLDNEKRQEEASQRFR
mgnify:FL=1